MHAPQMLSRRVLRNSCPSGFMCMTILCNQHKHWEPFSFNIVYLINQNDIYYSFSLHIYIYEIEHCSYIHYFFLSLHISIYFFSNMSASALRISLINVSVLYTKEQTLSPIFLISFYLFKLYFFNSLNIKGCLISWYFLLYCFHYIQRPNK